MPVSFLQLLERLRSSRFADLDGARLSATVPVSEALLNAVVAGALPPRAAVRDVTIHPRQDNRVTVRLKLRRMEFLPPIPVELAIEQQPALPDGPLVLRVQSWPGLVRLAGAALPLESWMPPAVRLEKDRIQIDVAALAGRHGYADLLPLIAGLRVTSAEGRLILDVDVRVGR